MSYDPQTHENTYVFIHGAY